MAKKQTLDLNKLIPSSLKNEALDSLVSNLFNTFLSEEKSIFLNGKIGKSNRDDLTIAAENLDRKINALIPAIYFKAGSEENILTFDDILNKMSVLGINTDNLKNILKEQSFNFAPPINYDKFINYQLYYWVGPAADSSLNTSLFSNWNISVEPEYYVIQNPLTSGEAKNSWQISNRWVHIDDFAANPQYVFSKAVQASRPIIEYSRNVELDAHYTSGGSKTKFNQVPQFKLYRYDGTFSGLTGGIFYYTEDSSAEIDSHLKRRVAKNSNGEFLFSVGIHDASERLLYYKDLNDTISNLTDDAFKTVWIPGVSSPTLSAISFSAATPGSSPKATFTVNTVSSTADSQTWEVISFEPTRLNVIGSRSGHVGVASVGQKFTCDDLEFTITLANANSPFVPGEKFDFTVHSPAIPRYVKDDGAGNIINYPGGASADVKNEGTWLNPLRMFQNISRENRTVFSYSDLIPHMSSVMLAQDNFTGFAVGINNSRQLTINYGLGGKIRDFSSNLPLLISTLIQSDISPLAVIEFAEKQYETAISSIDEFLFSEFSQYFASNVWKINDNQDIIPSRPCIQDLMLAFENRRAQNENLKSIFSDTTCLVKNWPISLPMMGLMKRVQPQVPSQIGALDYATFDFELGLDIIRHHDGHISYAALPDYDVDANLAVTYVVRSDGERTPGTIDSTAPARPYARQLWLNSSTKRLNFFDVDFDTPQAPLGTAGALWYNRNANELKVWNTTSSTWEVDNAVTVSSRWKALDFATIRNCLVGAIEQKLYDSVNPFFDNPSNLLFDINAAAQSIHAEGELARFSSKYNYDTFAPDYAQTNAFTWNYKQASPLSPITSTPARWFDIYKQYFNRPSSVLSTCRPNLEPWRLLGNATKPANWDSQYKAAYSLLDIDPAQLTSLTPVKVVSTTNITLNGLQTIDTVQVTAGDRVLVVGQPLGADNGIYVVSAGAWARLAAESTNDVVVRVSGGYEFENTQWIYRNSAFNQLRLWSNQMWAAIKTANPGMKLCVNIRTDELLPPYVSSTKFASAEALYTTIPNGTSNSYQFGDNGPVEIVWKKSIEYFYSLARNSFREFPLEFIDKTWGYSYVSPPQGSYKVERNLLTAIAPAKFLFHGEKLHKENRFTSSDVQARISGVTSSGNATVSFEVVHCSNNKTIFNMKVNDQIILDSDNKPIAIEEGVTKTISNGPFSGVNASSVKIDDLGLPFELGDILRITFISGTANYSFVPSLAKKFVGLCQWFTNLLRFNFISKDSSSVAASYRGWIPKLCHRVGSMVRPDSVVMSSSAGIIPSTAFDVVVKKSPKTTNKWLSALRIQLVDMGPEFNPANPSQKYIKQENGILTPALDASTWVFRIEGYTPQYPFLEYYSLDTSQSADFQTFLSLNGSSTDINWKRYLQPTVQQKITLPHIVTGLQNVLNILYGYIDKLTADGWSYSTADSTLIDEQTGRNLDWQLEIEKFIDTVYTGMSAGDGYILNPFMNKAVLSTPVGIMSVFSESNFIDLYSTQAAYDVLANRIPVNNLLVTRTDEKASITSSTPMFSMHVFNDEYEHCILFNDSYSDEDGTKKLFDAFTGLHLESVSANYVRSEYTDKKPSFGGFFISGNKVSRNIVSSIDNIASYYDAARTFSEKATSEHALALLGFTKKDYLNNLVVTDNSQFNFWRGMIQSKGTNISVDAILNYKGFGEASVDEFWAYKLSEFGDSRENSYPEIKINTRDVLQRLTKLQFYDQNDDLYSPLSSYIQIENNDDSRWFSIDDLAKGLKFEAQAIEESVEVADDGTFPKYIKLKHIYHNGYGLQPIITGAPGATVVNATTIRVTRQGSYKVRGYTWLSPSKFSPIKLFDYKENVLVKEIGLWHPAAGIHAYQPLEIINIINPTNPALHSYSVKTNDNPNSRILKPWGKNEVGVVWWNTQNLDYVPYYDANIFESNQLREGIWGNLTDWATIDLYQWTESDVHPSQYDALAAQQEGNAEIDNNVKAAGRVAVKNTYFRNRIIQIRPIAWSQLGAANGDGHPAFGPARFTRILASGNVLFADKGRLADIGITEGRSFGGWKNDRPYGEVTIGSAVQYNIGSSEALSQPDINPSGFISDITITLLSDNLFGVQVGPIYLKTIVDRKEEQSLNVEGAAEVNVVERHYARMMDDTGIYEDIEIEDWFSNDFSANRSKILEFDKFGLKVEITRSEQAPQLLLASQIARGISTNVHDIYVREGVNFSQIVPLPDGEIFINDETDPDFASTEYGWKVWDIPSQDDLDSDLSATPRKWKPYYGDLVTVTASPEIIKQIKAGTGSLTLRDGTSASRYITSWGEWTESKRKIERRISDTTSGVVFTVNETQLDKSRAAVYINGSILPESDYVISENKLTVSAVVRSGYELAFVYDKYTPTDDQLAFNPDVEDEISILVQYKQDYEYSKSDVRDENGNIVGSKYYFWVRDKTVPQGGKSMSLVQASQLLANGDSQYALLSRAIIRNEKVFFDSCSIYGLNTLVTKNDSYKLRFIRNFVLRDDPEELKLKNVHTEWALIRRRQSTKIPRKLWNLVVDAVCGQDVAGNPIPSMIRSDYDNRNGTRSRYGFMPGQIFADTQLMRDSVVNTILNTSLTINLGKTKLVNYIRSNDLDLNNSQSWFSTPSVARQTMEVIWRDASPKQINEIFFDALETAMSSNYEFSDIIKTSMFALNITRFDSAQQSSGNNNEIF